jgi:predicted outer membrane protein
MAQGMYRSRRVRREAVETPVAFDDTSRWINVVLGLWLMVAAWILSPGADTRGTNWTNDFWCGLAIVIVAFIASVVPAARYVNAAIGTWLVFAPFVIGYRSTAAVVNDVLIGVLVVFAALIPSFALPRRWIPGRAGASGVAGAVGVAVAVMLGFTGVATAQHADHGKAGDDASAGVIPGDAKTILRKVHEINRLEIAFGQIAKSNGESQRVKDYGERLIKDHEAANKQLTDLAKMKGIDLAQPVNAGSRKDQEQRKHHEQEMERLRGLKGKEFDLVFVDMMARDHDTSIDFCTAAGDKTNDQAVKTFLDKFILDLKKHQDIARTLQTALR